MALQSIDFDLWHEDGLLFDEQPELFVRTSSVPVVFTVRGIQYFSPRFRHVGMDIAAISTRADFEAAYQSWLDTERALILEKVGSMASATHAPNEHQLLQAILNGDETLAEQVVRRLEHRARAGLRVVGSTGA